MPQKNSIHSVGELRIGQKARMGHIWEMQSPRVVVIGSSNTDLVVSCDRLPSPGETLQGGEFERFGGGKGANQAVAAARAGAQTAFIGARGRDDFGKLAATALRREGIDTRYFKAMDGVTSGVALILLGGKSRENVIAVARSANDRLVPSDVDRAAALIRRADVIVAQLEIPLPVVCRAAEMAGDAGVPFILNPAPARKLPARLLRMVHVLVPNEHEAALLSGEKDIRRAAQALLRMGPRHVVITRGSAGVLLADQDGLRSIPACKVRPVDTVGAGDCFSAWLSVGIAGGLDLDAAAHRAVRAAALAVTRKGAQSGMPSLAEVSGLS